MTKSTVIIGIIMILAAAMFIYFADSSALQIVAGAIFLVGGIMMYYSLSTPEALVDESETSADQEEAQYSYSEEAHDEADGGPASAAGPRSPLTDPNLTSETAEQDKEKEFGAHVETPMFSDPKEEFDYLTKELLSVLKEHLMAHTVGLYWINRDRSQIVVGEFVSDSKNFTTAKRVNLGSDFISGIGTRGTPELISEIAAPSEMDLLPYYVEAEGVQSFVGVPLYFMDEVIAVIAADSKAPDAFGRETVHSMNHVVALVLGLLQSYNQKFDLMQDSRMMNVLDMMQNYIENHYDSYGIASATTRTITDIMDWDHVALVLNNPEKHGWTVVKSQTKSSSIPYVTEGSGVDLERSVLRQVIDDMDGMILDAPKAPAFRFHEKETIDSKGQICAVPLATPHKCYGLIAVEYRESHQYAQKDLEILTRIAGHAANALEIVSLRELTGKHLLIDEIAHVPSRGYLSHRLAEETSRISDQGGQGVFFLVAIDGPDDIIDKHGEAAIDTVVFHLGKLLPEHVKPFDFIGRADATRFGIFMISSGADDAYLRGEKLRKAVAALPIQYGGLTFSVSVSVAGCVVHQGMGSDAVMSLVQQVHDRAVSDGGNCVKIV